MTQSPDPVNFPVWNPQRDVAEIQDDMRAFADKLRVHMLTLRNHNRFADATALEEMVRDIENYFVPNLDGVGDEIDEAMRNRGDDL